MTGPAEVVSDPGCPWHSWWPWQVPQASLRLFLCFAPSIEDSAYAFPLCLLKSCTDRAMMYLSSAIDSWMRSMVQSVAEIVLTSDGISGVWCTETLCDRGFLCDPSFSFSWTLLCTLYRDLLWWLRERPFLFPGVCERRFHALLPSNILPQETKARKYINICTHTHIHIHTTKQKK